MNVWVASKVVLLMCLTGAPALASEFSTRIVDGLGRPVPDVGVMIYVFGKDAKGEVKEVMLANFRSDARGEVAGKYGSAVAQKEESPMVQIRKDGYAGYDDSNVLSREHVLRRKFDKKDVLRIAHLEGKIQIDQLRELLAGDVAAPSGVAGLPDPVTENGGRFHAALLALLDDAKVGKLAASMLAAIAMPEDMARIVASVPPPAKEFDANRWLYEVVTGLIEPTTETEWELLRQAAFNDYDDHWVEGGAIDTLRLNASARSRVILAEVAKKNLDRKQDVQEAIKYIDADARPIADPDPVKAGERAAHAVGLPGWKSNKPLRFNKDHSVALTDCTYIIDRDLLVYTATLHRVDGVWRLRAMRETEQALLAGNRRTK